MIAIIYLDHCIVKKQIKYEKKKLKINNDINKFKY